VPWFRDFLKRTLPAPTVNWFRRWLGTIRYVRFMSQEVLRYKSRLETGSSGGPLDTPMADPFYQLIVREVVERSDVLLQQLDRKIEGQGARHGERLRVLEGELTRLRVAVEELREALDRRPPAGSADHPGSPPEEVRAARQTAEHRKLATSD
jgi:hypothetical protein